MTVQGETRHYGEYIRIVERIQAIRTEGIDADIAYSARRLWLWVLQVKTMQEIIAARKASGAELDANHRQMEAYFRTLPKPLHERSAMGELLGTIFRRAVRILQAKGLDEYDDYLASLVGTAEFEAAADAMKEHMGDKTMLIVLDTLESYKIFQEYMLEAFRGILDALMALWQDSRMDHVYLKLFLPAEVFDKLFQAYPGKVMGRAVFMRWRSADLISMIGRRFMNVLVRTEAVSGQDQERLDEMVKKAYEEKDGRQLRAKFWYGGGFLPEKVRNTLGDQEDCFAYMFRHTQRRPRDVIAQMQSIVDRALENGEFPRISEKSIVAAVHRKRLLEQIVAESLTPYEGKFPMGLRKAAQTLFFQRPAIMSWREIRSFAEGIYSLAPVSDIDPKDFVEVLANCGVIGMLDERKSGSGAPGLYTKARFEYIMHGTVPLREGFHYCVHPAMADFLEMQLPAGSKAIYPFPETLEDSWLEDAIGII